MSTLRSTNSLASLYSNQGHYTKAEPHKGYDKKTTEWRARLAELEIEGEPVPTDKKLKGNSVRQ